jgi:restriction system protein
MKNKNKGPEFLRFINPLLEVLREIGGAGRPDDIRPIVVKKLKIPESEVEKTLESGVSRVNNQIDWARNYLREWEMLSAQERGIWRLTEKGFKERLSDEEIFKLFRTTQGKYQKVKDKKKPEVLVSENNIDEVIPSEKIHQSELLELIIGLSPYGFEKLCKRLLIEEGFQNVEITKQTKDGGIDGVAKLILNRFVSFKVFFQCKKYRGKVGSEDVQLFKGALDGKIKPGDKGLIITTGYFTTTAENEARREGGFPIELIDGEKLIEMFKSVQLGLKPRTVYDIDYDFFEDFKK